MQWNFLQAINRLELKIDVAYASFTYGLILSQELQEKHKKSKVCKNLELENPMLLDLCGILFPDNHKSVWSGPHSLNQHHRSARTSSIHAAIATFMK